MQRTLLVLGAVASSFLFAASSSQSLSTKLDGPANLRTKDVGMRLAADVKIGQPSGLPNVKLPSSSSINELKDASPIKNTDAIKNSDFIKNTEIIKNSEFIKNTDAIKGEIKGEIKGNDRIKDAYKEYKIKGASSQGAPSSKTGVNGTMNPDEKIDGELLPAVQKAPGELLPAVQKAQGELVPAVQK